ncbi:SDR family oxidoreductase [Rhizobium grahamii]|uniref:Short chain dehydrogenase n=1 Tax=Rhizobium grahamii CCGE 502 TaxID=990285 RepID=S3HUV9_9HYPH|nr:SDR family oxidoreductase [Rhizobium grahamii]EPE96976.1 short chain dehydrogenase [Rhizobium grahamii CCGE 502]
MSSKATAAKQREIQKQVDQADKNEKSKSPGAMQAGARRYPEPPYPAVHQDKPGSEADLPLAPLYDAPFYKGSEKLKDKVALITGGDSGIGRSVAILFAREGADVVIVHLDETEDAELTRAAVEKEGRKCLVIPGDVKDPSFCRKAVEKTKMQFSKLDILVNNAAFQVHAANIEDLTDEHFDETLKTNLYGYFYMAKAAIPHLRNGSAIINTGSVTGLEGSKELLDYSMTKGGIHAFTKALSGQLVSKGIRVNAVAPGPVWTPLNPSDKQAEDVATFGSRTPMKRAAQPEEIAPAYVFLASPQMSSYITGEIVPIVGGY